MTREEALAVVAFMTDLGWMALAGRGTKLVQLAISHPSRAATLAALAGSVDAAETGAGRWQKLIARLQDYAAGKRVDFRDVELELDHLGAFQRRVVAACRAIPYGQTRGYGELAAECGSPRGARGRHHDAAQSLSDHRALPSRDQLWRGDRQLLRLRRRWHQDPAARAGRRCRKEGGAPGGHGAYGPQGRAARR